MQPKRRTKQTLRFTVSYDKLLYTTYLRAMGNRTVDLWSVTDLEGNAYRGLGRILDVGEAKRHEKTIRDFELTIAPIGKWNIQSAD